VVFQLRTHEDAAGWVRLGLVSGGYLQDGVKPIQHFDPVIELTLL
jgi:hypothetical protein